MAGLFQKKGLGTAWCLTCRSVSVGSGDVGITELMAGAASLRSVALQGMVLVLGEAALGAPPA